MRPAGDVGGSLRLSRMKLNFCQILKESCYLVYTALTGSQYDLCKIYKKI